MPAKTKLVKSQEQKSYIQNSKEENVGGCDGEGINKILLEFENSHQDFSIWYCKHEEEIVKIEKVELEKY